MHEPRTTSPGLDDSVHVFHRIRAAEFPWTTDVTYLNCASIGPMPERTRRVVIDLTAKRAAPHLLVEEDFLPTLRAARVMIGRLINAAPEEVALTTNTSFGLNVAARALPIAPGEVVVLAGGEFPANVYPWLQLRERGVEVEFVPATAEGWPDEGRLLERLGDPRVRVLAVSLVQFATGYRADLARLGAAARANGSYVVVDAIQGIGQFPFDVHAVPVDIVACGAQKWLLAPWGAGFLYVRRSLISQLTPPFAGWMAFKGTDDFTGLTRYDTRWHGDARRFELVTLPFQDIRAMTESVGFLLELGIERIATHLQRVRQPLFEAADAGAFTITSPRDGIHDSAIVCLRTSNTRRAYEVLTRAGIVVAFREGAIRLSPHCYNTPAEMEGVVEVLAGAR